MKKGIENFKPIISEKDKQLQDLENISEAAKISYRTVKEKNKQLKQPITLIKKKYRK